MGLRDFAPDNFAPMSSGPELDARPDFFQDFLRRAAPQVVGNQVEVQENGLANFDANPTRLVEILRVTFPVPTPTAITFMPWSNTVPLQAAQWFPGESTGFPAAAEFTTAENQQGRYVVEFGVGKSRSNLFTDFAPGSVQLPLAQYVSVSAIVYNLNDDEVDFGGVVVSPNTTLENASATFTHSVRVTADDTETINRVPFCSQASFYFANESTNDDDWGAGQLLINGLKFVPASAGGAGGDASTRVAQWVVPAVIQPNGGIIPCCNPQPLPGNLNQFEMAFDGVGAASGGFYAVGTVVQHIRVA